MEKKSFIISFIMAGLALIASCSSGGSAGDGSSDASGDTLTSASRLLTMIDCGGYIVADVRNPWADGLMARYLLVPEGYEGDLPEGTVVTTPLHRSVIFSSVYSGAVAELGAIDAISGVADGRFFVMPQVAGKIASGRIRDVGNSMSPSPEAIVDCDPGAIILSPYQGQQQNVAENLGLPVIQMVDYMEPEPLGRAEWIRLIGALYGRRSEADSVYNAVVSEYTRLCGLVADVGSRPVVVTEQPQPGGSWDVPSGESYMARMLSDAGARYPWALEPGAGSLKLDVAAVYDKARSADYWLIRSYGPLTAADLRASGPLPAQFKALTNGGLYICDTSRSPLFDEFPFHPERLLADYIAIFHPAANPSHILRYFERAK